MDGGPFQKLAAQWITKIKSAREQKKEFARDAEEGMKFFRGPYDFMYGLKEGVPQSGDFVFVGVSGTPKPAVAMTLNKVAEAVQIFGPTLYHRNPDRKVNPRVLPMLPPEAFGDPNDPQLQQYMQQLSQAVTGQRSHDKSRAALLQWYQDYTPTATDLKTECRMAIDEGLIKGMGVLWPELWTPPASQMRIVASRYDSVDNLLIDGDMELRRDAKFIVRIRTKPVWEFEATFHLEPGTVKGSGESYSQREMVEGEGGTGELARRQGKTNDLITYYEVFSKMGMGPQMSGTEWNNDEKAIDVFGQYCYLVVCRELKYPANIPPAIQDNPQAIAQAVQWPTPFWLDDSWPFAELVFHDVPNQIWPMSHFKPAMGELKFLNWAYSFLASRVKKSSRDILVLDKGVSEEMRRAILDGEDMELVSIEKSHGKSMKDVLNILTFPEVNGDMFKVIELVTHLFEQRTGLSELMYGETAHAYRSAEEANVKQSALHVRPDDMVNKTEDWMTQVARMEALIAKWQLEPDRDIAPVMGKIGAQWWGQFITAADPMEILHQMEYRIEANSSRKPNKAKEADDANTAMQNIFQPLLGIATSHGIVGPVNALLTAWAEANSWDATPFLIPQPPPPQTPPDQPKINVAMKWETLDQNVQQGIVQMAGIPVPPPDPNSPPNPAQQQAMLEHQKAQQEMAAKQQDAQLKAAQASQELQHKAAHANVEAITKQHEAAQKAAQHQQDMAVKQHEMAHKQQMAAQALQHAEAVHQQALRQAAEKHQHEMKLAEHKAKQPQVTK